MFSLSLGRLLVATACLGALAGISSVAWSQTAQISLTPGMIRTYAGGGAPASGVGDEGQATSAKLVQPRSLAFDSTGNLYIADTGENRVRKVTPAGVISTVAGTGSASSTGNGGQAALATLNVPAAIVFDKAGNLYIAEANGNVVRKIDTTGIITIFAGTGVASSTGDLGQATAATINSPGGLAMDASGNLYISETNGNRVRKVNTSGVISTVAGTGTTGSAGDNGLATNATFNQPRNIAIDAVGNLFIADYMNNKIRRVDAVSGIVTTAVGTGTASFAGDGGLATAAKISAPRGVNFDPAGDMLIADGGNGRIRKVDPAGIITTVAGGATATTVCSIATDTLGDSCPATSATLALPLQAITDSAGTLYIAEFTNSRVRAVNVQASLIAFGNQVINSTSATNIVTVSNTGTTSFQFSGLSISGTGFAIATSGGTDCTSSTSLAVGASCLIGVQFAPTAVAPATGSIVVTDNTGGVAGSMQTIALTGTGALARPTVSVGVNPVSAGNGQTVTFTSKVTGTGGVIPMGMVQFLNGTSVLAQGPLDGTGNISLTNSTLSPGNYTVTASYGGDAHYNAASSSSSVRLAVSAQAGSVIALHVTPSSANIGQTIALSTTVSAASGSTMPTGTVTFLDGTTALGTPVTLIAGAASMNVSTFTYGAHVITVSYSGDLNFTAGFSTTVTVYVGTLQSGAFSPGILSTTVGTGSVGFAGDGGAATAAKLNQPVRSAFDKLGNFYLADSNNAVVREVTAAGVINTVAGMGGKPAYGGDGGLATAANLFLPRDVGFDSAGNMFILDSQYNVVRKVDTNGIITTIAGVPSTTSATSSGDGGPATAAMFNQPRAMAVDGQGNVYVAEYAGSVVRKINTEGTISSYAGVPNSAGNNGNGGLATAAKLSGPYGLVFDAAGNLFIAELNNNDVRKVTPSGMISLFAGTGSSGYAGDGGLATAALLAGPRGVGIDAAGSVYIADTANAVVRRVDTSGVIATVAGTHTAGYTGDGGAATGGEINSVYGMSVDAANNLYFDDLSANVVRKVTVNASAVMFPAQLLHTTSAVSSVSFYNAGGQALTISSITASGASFSTAPSGGTDCTATTVLAPGASCLIGVSFTPTALTTYTGTVVVTSDSAGVAGTQETIALTGVGTLVPVTTTLTISPTAVTKGESVTFTATVAPTMLSGPPTVPSGTVTFMNGTSTLNTVPLNNSGVASFTTTTLPRNNYSIVAVYSGDTVYNPGSSTPPVALVVNGVSTSVLISVSANSVAQGAPVTFKATLTATGGPSPATGTVTFSAGSTVLGTVPLQPDGTASYPGSFPLVGTQSVTATYSGDDTYDPSTSPPISVTVTAGPNAAVTPGIVNLLAGIGTTGFSGDGGPANTAKLTQPNGTEVVDSSGNLYFPDYQNNRVRRITPAGIITTIAGTGVAGSTGDGGLATAARIELPRALAMDAAGNLYITGYGENRIRKVDTSGIITTIAGNGTTAFAGDGGPATAAGINAPQGVAVDAVGNIYLSDTGNQRVRKVDTSGMITTIVGNGTAGSVGDGGSATAAEVNAPTGLALDAAGNLYITDSKNNRIRKVDTAGIITTVAGKGSAMYTGDGGLATAANLNGPTSIALDAGGGLYIADGTNNIIRKVDSDGYISTIVGSHVAGNSGDGDSATAALLSGPNGIGVDSIGSIYFGDSTHFVVRKVTTTSGILNAGTIAFGSTITSTVQLSNTGAQPLVVSAIASTGLFTTSTPTARGCTSTTTLAPGTSCLVTVTFAPAAVGSYSGSVTFTDNSQNTAGSTQVVSLVGIGGEVTPSFTVSSTPASFVTPGNPVTFSAVIVASNGVAAVPTGSVVFMNGAAVLGTGMLDATGKATISVTNPSIGLYTVTAVYAGDSNFLAGTSSPYLFQVQNDFTLALSSSSGTISAGGTVTTVATLTALGTLPGDVSFGCSGQPSYLVCTFSPATLLAGASPLSTTLTITSTAPPVGKGLLRIAVGSMLLLLVFGRRKRLASGLMLVALIGVMGCGNGVVNPTPTVVPVTVYATTGQAMHSVVYNVAVK